MESFDLTIIGAGPIGLAAAIDAKRAGIDYVVLEKGILVNSIFNFPTFMQFFTEANLLEIGGYPLPSTQTKPTREQAMDYYRRVAEIEEINIKYGHEVVMVEEGFTIKGKKTCRGQTDDFELISKYVILATGYFDNPVGLGGIPGEDGSTVSYYYDEPHQYFGKEVTVIGAGNSGAEAALDLYRHGAKVTLVHNYPAPKSTLKYWIGPDLLNRIQEGNIRAVMPAKTVRIDEGSVTVIKDGDEVVIPADRVFILTGFTPNMDNLEAWGIKFDAKTLACELTSSFESSVPNLYLIGSVGFGRATNSVFIENGRDHAKIAVNDIKTKMKM